MKNFKRLLSAAMALTMVASVGAISVSADDVTSVVATVGGAPATISATTNVTEPVINVTVPTTFAFALNPYEVGGVENSQITSDDFKVINASNVPVNVGVTVATTLKSAFLVDSDDKILNNGVANAFIQIAYASAWTRDNKGSGDAKKMAAADDEDSNTKALAYATSPVTTTLGATSNFDLMLEAATYTGGATSALSALGEHVPAASFKLTGKLDEAFLWTNSNIAMKVSYKITSMKGTTYTSRAEATAVDDALGLVAPTLLTSANEKSAVTLAKGDIVSVVGVGALTIKSIGTYDISTKKITPLKATTDYILAGNTVTWVADADATKSLAFTMSDGTNYYYTNAASDSTFTTTAPTAAPAGA